MKLFIFPGNLGVNIIKNKKNKILTIVKKSKNMKRPLKRVKKELQILTFFSYFYFKKICF